MSSTQYASFLVRLWREGAQKAGHPGPAWQGEVEHIQTSRRTTFDSLEELLRLLLRQLDEANAAGQHE